MTTSAKLPTFDFDHNDAARSSAETRRNYDAMRAACPVVHVDRHGGFLMVNGYAALKEATTGDSMRSGDGISIPESGVPRIPALEFDGAAHARWRDIMAALVGPAVVPSYENLIRDVVDRQIDTFCAAGEVDLVESFTHPVPGIVIGRVFGLDHEDSLRSQALTDETFRAFGTPEMEEKLGAFASFMMERIDVRRSEPRDDFLTALAQGSVNDRSVHQDEAFPLMIAILGGGHHSTGSGLAGLLRHVLTRPEVRALALQDPRACQRMIDESLRLTTPLQLFARTATEDVSLAGCPVASGDRLLLNFASANRDPEIFVDPDEFNPARRRNPHVAFGSGLHSCVGQHLARLELRIALTQLLTRLPDIALTGAEETSGLISGQLVTTLRMPATFSPAA